MLYRHYVRTKCAAENSRTRVLAVVLLIAALGAGSIQAQSPGARTGSTGSIGGTVTDPKGNIVVGVKVWAIRTFSSILTSDPIEATADTNPMGMYSFPALAPASYRLCVSAEGAMLLDPCSWSGQPPVWNLEGGQVAIANLKLARGTFVHVRVDDPNGAITTKEQASSGPALLISGASSSGRRIQFMPVVSDASGRNFRALVPSGEAVQLQFTTDLKVMDLLGNPVSLPAAAATPTALTSTTPSAPVGQATVNPASAGLDVANLASAAPAPVTPTPVFVTGSVTEQTIRLKIQ